MMVGAFGEVQVVDWGLAKVLAEGGVADEEQASRQRRGPEEGTTIRTARGAGSTGSTGPSGRYPCSGWRSRLTVCRRGQGMRQRPRRVSGSGPRRYAKA